MTLESPQAVDLLRAAGEPTRLRILALLAREELAVLELCRILGQSQPRVSRHLRLLTEAGLTERFPDGAWVFYRLVVGGAGRAFLDAALGLIDPADRALAADAERLEAIRAERAGAAAAYFARNAAHWDRVGTLYVSEVAVEAAVLEAAGPGPFAKLVDLGTGAGRMLTLLAPKTEAAVGLDLSQQMLNVARTRVAEAGLSHCELRHGDIYAAGLPGGTADLVVVHQVLHYLGDPAAAVVEAGRLVAPGGRLVIVDFAPHQLEFLREQHQHRRLGFADREIGSWLAAAGLSKVRAKALPPAEGQQLTVKIWSAERVREAKRSAA